MLPLGANIFLLEETPFQQGIGVQGSKQEVTKIVSIAKNGRQSVRCIHYIKCMYGGRKTSSRTSAYVKVREDVLRPPYTHLMIL